MKVFELMNILKDLPAGMTVSLTGTTNNGDPFPIESASYDKEDLDAASTLILIFDDSEMQYIDDSPKDKAA